MEKLENEYKKIDIFSCNKQQPDEGLALETSAFESLYGG